MDQRHDCDSVSTCLFSQRGRYSRLSDSTITSTSSFAKLARSRPSNPPTNPSSAPRARFLPRFEVDEPPFICAAAGASGALVSNSGASWPRERRRRRVGYSTGTREEGYCSRKNEWNRRSWRWVDLVISTRSHDIKDGTDRMEDGTVSASQTVWSSTTLRCGNRWSPTLRL
jgi:hypothetical protein